MLFALDRSITIITIENYREHRFIAIFLSVTVKIRSSIIFLRFIDPSIVRYTSNSGGLLTVCVRTLSMVKKGASRMWLDVNSSVTGYCENADSFAEDLDISWCFPAWM